MADPTLVSGGKTLLEQLDKRWPEREKELDGWLADGFNQPPNSDHYPDESNMVHALDIDINFDPKSFNESQHLAGLFANELISYVRSATPGSERIKYVVYNNKIASAKFRDRFWVWRDGDFGCTNHIHIGFSKIGQSDPRRFSIPILMNVPSSPVGIKQPPLKIEKKTAPEFPGKERLTYGEQNESVRRMQTQLIAKDYLGHHSSATGFYDKDTAYAVRMVYHNMRKNSDGLSMGPAAWNFLFGE